MSGPVDKGLATAHANFTSRNAESASLFHCGRLLPPIKPVNHRKHLVAPHCRIASQIAIRHPHRKRSVMGHPPQMLPHIVRLIVQSIISPHNVEISIAPSGIRGVRRNPRIRRTRRRISRLPRPSASAIIVKLASINISTFAERELARLPSRVARKDPQNLVRIHRRISAQILIRHPHHAVPGKHHAHAIRHIHPGVARAPIRAHHLPARPRQNRVLLLRRRAFRAQQRSCRERRQHSRQRPPRRPVQRPRARPSARTRARLSRTRMANARPATFHRILPTTRMTKPTGWITMRE
jgi:hypothetical protein